MQTQYQACSCACPMGFHTRTCASRHPIEVVRPLPPLPVDERHLLDGVRIPGKSASDYSNPIQRRFL